MDEFQETQESTREIDLLQLAGTVLRRWPWVVLSVAVCMSVALLYILCTPPVYTRTASIVIKDESKGASAASEMEAFANMGLLQTHSNINDEVNKLQSPDVMEAVVKRLGLDMSYYVDGDFHKEIIYGPQVPVAVSFPSMMETGSAKAEIAVSADGFYTVSHLEIDGKEADVLHSGKTALGDTVRTSGGPIVVAKTPYSTVEKELRVFVARIPLKEAVTKFSKELTVELKSDKGNTIDITAKDLSPQRAEDLINGVISIYNENWIENRNQISVSTSNFISERLSLIEGELGNVDHDISSYQSQHLIPDVQQAASMYMSENQAAAAQILDLGNQLQMTRYMRGYLTDDANKSTVLPANSGIGNPAIENQIAEYNALMLQRNQLAANSSDTHPVVVDKDTQLAGMRAAIISTIDNQIVALNTQIRNLQSNKNRTTARIAENPTQAKYLLSVERQQKVKESLYLFLLQKREENELSQAFTAYNTQVISKPNGPTAPTSPKKAQILMAALALGIVIPVGIIFFMESNNSKVRGRKDIERLRVPFLGEIPRFRVKGRKSSDDSALIVVEKGKRDAVNEAMRVLRTNIGFMASRSNKCNVLMVTSFNPGSGKSFITVNLGISMAIRGKKVLVIDCDLRRGSASSYVGSPKEGLSNYLAGDSDDINGMIVSDTITEGFSILPAGITPPNPTELLETERFAPLVETLRADYDYIFIDCPPAELLADAQIVDKVADSTIFVIRAGLMERHLLPEIDRIYTEKKFKNMGIVLNDTSTENTRYGYGYGYGKYDRYSSSGK